MARGVATGGRARWAIRASGCPWTGDTGYVECGYCDKKFVHADFAEAHGLTPGDDT